MGMEKKLQKVYRESIKYLESMSALEFMKDANLFMLDLRKLVNSQHLPNGILIGCLMQEIHRLNTDFNDAMLDDSLTKAFTSFKRYADENFMKKE